MTVPVGGLRARLIRESLYRMLHDSLDDLGWFDTVNRRHAPVALLPDEVPNRDAVQPNTAAIAELQVRERGEELGSNLTEHRWTLYVDFYGENNAVAIDFSTDIKDILGGRMPSINRTRPNLPVYDWRMATPSIIFNCQIEDIMVEKVALDKPFKHFWYTVRFDVLDSYGGEDD